MRKALIGLIMAATAITPVAAQAQDGGSRAERMQQHYQRMTERNQQRHEQRQSRQENRAQRQAQPAQPAEIAQRDGRRGDRGGRGDWNRGDRGGDRGTRPSGYERGWQGPPGTENSRAADRYNRRAQENAIRNGTPAQRRDAIRDARRDGNDWRQWDNRRDRDRRDWRDDRRDWRNDRRDWRDDRRDWRDGRRGDRGDWNRGWRNDRRYDWRGWRDSNRHIFRGSRYYSPYRGWNYSRFSIGFLLQPLFYDQRYWIGDPWEYRLPPAPYGTQWVRYYNDVLLVDTYTGEVVDAIYDFFW
jgi:Ni/Co efflux regulator RcnB